MRLAHGPWRTLKSVSGIVIRKNTIILYSNQVEYNVSRPVAYYVMIKRSSGTSFKKIASVLLVTLPKNGHTCYFRRELRNNFIYDLPWNHFHAEYQGRYCYTVRIQRVCGVQSQPLI